MLAAKVYYFLAFGGIVFVYPYLNLYYKSMGITEDQIGLMAACRPWINALSGNVWSVVADTTHTHKTILVVNFVIAAGMRFSVGLVDSLVPLLALMAGAEIFGAPIGSIVDATVLATCKEAGDEGGYGKHRMWGAIGWGGMSAVAGTVVAKFGIHTAFYVSLGIMLVAVIPTCLLPVHKLSASKRSAAAAAASVASPAVNPDAESPAAPSPPSTPPSLADYAGPPLQRQGYKLVLEDAKERSRLLDRGDSVSSQAEADALLPPGGGRSPVYASPKHTPPRSAGSSRLGPPRDSAATGPAPESHGCQDGSQGTCPNSNQPEQGPGPVSAGTPQPAQHQGSDKAAGATVIHVVADARTFPAAALLGDRPADSSPPDNLAAPCLPSGQALADSDQLTVPLLQSYRSDLDGDSHSAAEGSKGPAAPTTTFAKYWQLFSNGEVLIFFMQAILMGFGMGTIDCFLFLYLAELGASDGLLGLTITVTCVAEVPVFWGAGWLLRVIGAHNVLNSVLFIFCLRMAAYCALWHLGTPWAVLPIELLHGVTFGCGWVAGTTMCGRISPPGLEASTQAVFQGLYSGVGVGLGGLVGGLIYKHCGPHVVFGVAGLVIGAGWLLCLLLQLLRHCLRRASMRRKADALV